VNMSVRLRVSQRGIIALTGKAPPLFRSAIDCPSRLSQRSFGIYWKAYNLTDILV